MLSLYFLNIFFNLFLERWERREKEREKHRLIASHTSPPGDLACNPGMWRDRELNWRPFSSQAGAQSTEPRQPGLKPVF